MHTHKSAEVVAHILSSFVHLTRKARLPTRASNLTISVFPVWSNRLFFLCYFSLSSISGASSQGSNRRSNSATFSTGRRCQQHQRQSKGVKDEGTSVARDQKRTHEIRAAAAAEYLTPLRKPEYPRKSRGAWACEATLAEVQSMGRCLL